MGVVKDAITKKYCSFHGRANRKQYWLITLTLALIQLVLFGFYAGLSFNLFRFGYNYIPSNTGFFLLASAFS
jgi:uncharacterized membrane protein YhaH (DUF805 family)